MRANPVLTGLLALCIPGGGHFLVGQARKAAIFFVVLVAMFLIGLQFGGEIFRFQVSDILGLLAALAQCGLALLRFGTALIGAGRGEVTATTYEYGNTFLIVGGLLNLLVAMDAIDIARGAKKS
jgi:hypothetical protein